MEVLKKITSRIDSENKLVEKLHEIDFPDSRQMQSKTSSRHKGHRLDSGFIFVPAEPIIINARLGSGMSVCVFDSNSGLGGMNHYELPYTEDKVNSTAHYGNIAIETLLKMMQRAGGGIPALQAQIFGGAFNSRFSNHDVGLENYITAREILEYNGIEVIAFDVGGEKGRELYFNAATGGCFVQTVSELPEEYWFPYDRS